MQSIIAYILNNKFCLLLAICFVSSVVVPISYNQMPYVLGLLLLGANQLSNNRQMGSPIFLLFIVILIVGGVVNLCFSSRLFLFLFVLIISSGMLYSEQNFNFRVNLFSVILDVVFVVNILNIYCYFAGINYYVNVWLGWQNYFSGLAPHPMWLAVVSGVANVANVHRLFVANSVKWRVVYALLVLLTLFLQFTAGSRAGLLATAMAVLVYFRTYFRDMSSVVLITAFSCIVIYALLPMLMSDASLLTEKIEEQDMENNSRNELWAARINEFLMSPIFGVGFARGYVDGVLVEGRLETGNGWLAVLSQTGIFAFICVATLVLSVLRNISAKWLPQKGLFFAIFIFLCVHSCFEGYLYTSFYMPCLLFWLLLGILLQAPNADEVEFVDDDEISETDEFESDDESTTSEL